MKDPMREAFEQEYALKYGSAPRAWDERIQAYRDAHANGAYWAWRTATVRAYGDGHRAGFEAGLHAATREVTP